MPIPCSKDLRWRAVWLSIVHKMSPGDIANELLLSERTVYRYIELFHTTGDIEPKDSKVGMNE